MYLTDVEEGGETVFPEADSPEGSAFLDDEDVGY